MCITKYPYVLKEKHFNKCVYTHVNTYQFHSHFNFRMLTSQLQRIFVTNRAISFKHVKLLWLIRKINDIELLW